LSKPIYEDDSKAVLIDVLAETKLANPEDIIMNQEAYADIQEDTKAMLSPLEYKVLLLFIEGKSYQEISTELGRHLKSIDNALQRIKRKFEIYLKERKEKSVIYHTER
jgi:RNA polymerase sporulation-specific sigma factor